MKRFYRERGFTLGQVLLAWGCAVIIMFAIWLAFWLFVWKVGSSVVKETFKSPDQFMTEEINRHYPGSKIVKIDCRKVASNRDGYASCSADIQSADGKYSTVNAQCAGADGLASTGKVGCIFKE